MEFKHYSVMLNECLDGLNISPDGIYIDGTAGGAGHSLKIASMLKNGRLISLDRDPDAVKTASERLKPYANAKVIQTNFAEIEQIARNENIYGKVNGVLLDLGVSSFQLDNPDRGFTYKSNVPLDMRMSKTGLSAEDVVNTYGLQELAKILRDYGEEKFAVRIAGNIVKYREKKKISASAELEQIIKASVPAASRREKNPCKRTFQAIRIEVNNELGSLMNGLEGAFEALAPGGRLVVITFHSLEDRIVKNKFKEYITGCICPPDFPVCVCGKQPRGRLINKKPITASDKELSENKRSHSAKLRIIEKI